MSELNGQQADALLQRIAAQQQAEAVLTVALQQALQNPLITKRVTTSLVAISNEEAGAHAQKVLHVAIPNGERWDIPLSSNAERALLRALTGGGSELGE